MLYIPHLMTHLLCFSVGSYFFQITVSHKIYIHVKKWKLSGLLLVLEIQKCSLNFSCSHKLHTVCYRKVEVNRNKI